MGRINNCICDSFLLNLQNIKLPSTGKKLSHFLHLNGIYIAILICNSQVNLAKIDKRIFLPNCNLPLAKTDF